MDELRPFMFDTKPYQAQSFASAAASQPRLGTEGGRSGGTLDTRLATSQFDGPDNFVPQFFNKLIGPQMEAARRLKFFQGAAQVMAGKTREQIHDQQPWFANVFGQTPYEEGATVYTADKSAAEMAREVHENMDKFKDKSPEEMGAYLNEQSAKMLTGDVLADSVIQKSWLTATGPIMEAQAKASYAWKQDELARTQLENVTSQGRLYNAVTSNAWKMGQDHPDQPVDPAQEQAAIRPLLDSLQLPDGQNTESYFRTVENASYDLAREGQWHAIRAMKKTGLLDHMPVEQQERIEKKLDTIGRTWLNNMAGAPEMKEAMQILSANAGGVLSAEESTSRMHAFNEKFAARTGYTDGYFNNSDFQQAGVRAGTMVYSALQRQLDDAKRDREKAATAADKAASDDRENALVASAAVRGQLGDYLVQPGSDSKKADASLRQIVDSNIANHPDVAMQAIDLNFSNPRNRYVSEGIKNQIAAATTAGAGKTYNDAVGGAARLFDAMYNFKRVDGSDDGRGPAMAQAYFGPSYEKMYRFSQLKQAGLDDQLAYEQSFGEDAFYKEGDLRGGAGYKENQKALGLAVDKLSPGFLARWGGAVALPQSTKDLIAYRASPYFEQLQRTAPHLGAEVIAQQAVQHFQDNGGEIAGKYAWENGPSHTSVAKTLGMPSDVFGSVFDMAVTNKLRKAGLSVDSGTRFQIYRMDDKNGVRMYVQGFSDKDGVSKGIHLDSAEFNDFKRQYDEELRRGNGRPDELNGKWNLNPGSPVVTRPDAG